MSEHVRKPVLPLAWVAVAMAFAAAVFALYGSFLSETHLPGSPLNIARNQPGLPNANAGAIAFFAYSPWRSPAATPCGRARRAAASTPVAATPFSPS